MNVTCPKCETTYRVDPRKVPTGGVRARCAECSNVFPVTANGAASAASGATAPPAHAPAPAAPAAPAPAAPPAPAPPPAAPPAAPEPEPETMAPTARRGPTFGAADPHAKAKRLARALISDIVVYHPERRERSLADGTLRQEFREEIQKSWEEYAAQVGSEFARETPYFREALNEILANGARLF